MPLINRKHFSEISIKALRLLPPEASHNVGLFLLKNQLFKLIPQPFPLLHRKTLQCSIPGIGPIKSPICLAAGFDKNATCINSLMDLNFGMIEVGTVTPKSQAGNPIPRLFRYPHNHSIINRMGFNNVGSLKFKKNIMNSNPKKKPLGINLGMNKSTPLDRAHEDYLQGLEMFKNLCSYFVINISSPNTKNLRNLANSHFLKRLSKDLPTEIKKLIWIKLDPDMSKKNLQQLTEVVTEECFSGLILTNTHKVSTPQSGGLSGKPILNLSNQSLEYSWEVHKGSLPMIGVGGILTGKDAFEKIARGSCAVQIYSALVYRGPWVVQMIANELCKELQLRGFKTISEAQNSHYHSN